MLLHKSAEHDARVRREARALSDAGHEVVIVHLPSYGSSTAGLEAEPYEIRTAAAGPRAQRLPKPARWAIGATRLASLARRERPDAIHAHDAAMLVPGHRAARRVRAKLVYDSHELATGVPYRSRGWTALVGGIERRIVPRCDAVLTVSDGIAERIQAQYGLPRLPAVVRNLPDLPPPSPGPPPVDLRVSFGIGDAPLILHHGAVAAGRGGETLIRALALTEGAHLLFLGADGPYAARIERLSAELGVGGRAHFHPPVRLEELLSYTSQADLGVTLLEDTCENHRLALPNKAFEYVAAGIPVVASDLPELRRVVADHGIGWTVDPANPDSVAAGLLTAIDARGDAALRDRVRIAAAELSWEREKTRLLDLYASL